MKFNVEVDSKDVKKLLSLYPLRNRRKKELQQAREIAGNFIPKKNGFLGTLSDSFKQSELDAEVRKKQRLYEIDESTFVVILDDLEIFLNDIMKQICLKQIKEKYS